jgi:HEAT repeat protein
VLGQLGYVDRTYPFRHSTYPILEQLLDDDFAPVVQASLTAFGHLGAGDHIERVAALATHSEPSVRQAVAFALLSQPAGNAVSTLIQLSRDEIASVRDWATFGLGTQLDLDTPELRDALAARLEDSDPDTLAEAICGLARRRDPRTLEPFLRVLERDACAAATLVAARDLGSRDLLQALKELRTRWTADPELLESAISDCSEGIETGSG